MNEQETHHNSPLLLFACAGWILSLIIVSFLSYHMGKNSLGTRNTVSQPASGAFTATTGVASQDNPVLTPAVDLNGICKKSGVSQKTEYLIPYTIQNGDTLAKIAENELNDATRVNEITKLNEDAVGLSAGSILYLPPENIKTSSGNLALVSGRIIKKDNAVWQLSYGGGEKGLGITIPAYYFTEVENKDQFLVGDCVTVFLDNGVKTYTVTKQ